MACARLRRDPNGDGCPSYEETKTKFVETDRHIYLGECGEFLFIRERLDTYFFDSKTGVLVARKDCFDAEVECEDGHRFSCDDYGRVPACKMVTTSESEGALDGAPSSPR